MKIIEVMSDGKLEERVNLRTRKNLALKYTDVAWHPSTTQCCSRCYNDCHVIKSPVFAYPKLTACMIGQQNTVATATSSGRVVLWDLLAAPDARMKQVWHGWKGH